MELKQQWLCNFRDVEESMKRELHKFEKEEICLKEEKAHMQREGCDLTTAWRQEEGLYLWHSGEAGVRLK